MIRTQEPLIDVLGNRAPAAIRLRECVGIQGPTHFAQLVERLIQLWHGVKPRRRRQGVSRGVHCGTREGEQQSGLQAGARPSLSDRQGELLRDLQILRELRLDVIELPRQNGVVGVVDHFIERPPGSEALADGPTPPATVRTQKFLNSLSCCAVPLKSPLCFVMCSQRSRGPRPASSAGLACRYAATKVPLSRSCRSVMPPTSQMSLP